MTTERWATARAVGLAERAAQLADDHGVEVAVVVVDRAGQLLVVRRHDAAAELNVELARRKAVAAVSLRAPTSMIARLAADDPLAARALQAHPDVLAVPGASPVVVDGRCVGALGIAGGHHSQDQTIADAALAAALPVEAGA